ncbi:Paf1 complex component [Coemansia sp. RSA 2703]|nr:Paf1 complex component [Coemansia sp. RSA 2703]KAJ2371423.1 Paf1 complex component [Coemansia sp. RSA 2607]KAJ2395163.1 Paf1 complex component [Coemansia sp. RSA 2603]
MSDLFGSDVSDSEGPSLGTLRSGPSKSARKDNGQARSSATPEPTEQGGNEDLFGSDSEGAASPARHTKAEHSTNDGALDNLFDSGSDSDADARTSVKHEEHSDGEDSGEMDIDDDEEGTPTMQVKTMRAYVPVLALPRSSDGKYVLARAPNLMQLDPTPFTPDAYEDLIPREHSAMEHGVKDAVSGDIAMAVEGIIANTIRWRRVTDSDGQTRRESNARLVRWSDGSTTVVIGGTTPESYSIMAESLMATPAGEQHNYAAALHPTEFLMQTHARLTDQWVFKQSVQSATGRLAVSKLLERVRSRTAGYKPLESDAAQGTGSRVTRFRNIDTDPELLARRAVKEEEERERQRRKEEKIRERREARELQHGRDARAGAYGVSDDEMEYASDDIAARPVPSHARSRTAREPSRFGAPAVSRGMRGSYVDDEDDGFVVDDDEELEVGPRDEFDDEEEEEEMAARQLNGAKRAVYSDDEDDEGARRASAARGGKPRRVMVSDDEDDDSNGDDM